MGEIVVALREDPTFFSFREGILVVAATLLFLWLGVWKLRTASARIAFVLAGLAVGAMLWSHFTDVQTSVVLGSEGLTVTKLHSPGWSIKKSELKAVEIRRMRTKDELVVVTSAGDVKLIRVEGSARRQGVAEAIGRHFGMQQTTSGSWIRP